MKLSWIIKAIYLKLFLKLRRYHTIVIGNYNNIFAFYLACRFSKNNRRVYHIDDGTATIEVFKQRNVYNNFEQPVNFKKGALNKFLKVILNLKKRDKIKKIYFYSVFHKHLYQQSTIDKINPLIFAINENNNSREGKLICYFIGQPLIEKGLITKENFDLILNKVIAYFSTSNTQLKYVYHRFEKEKQLSVESIRYNTPLELIFNNSQSTEKKFFSSFFSTALINLSLMYPNNNNIAFDISPYLIKNSDKISQIMDYFGDVCKVESI